MKEQIIRTCSNNKIVSGQLEGPVLLGCESVLNLSLFDFITLGRIVAMLPKREHYGQRRNITYIIK